MRTGKSINRPVQARHLELAARRRDYKIHLQKLNPQKGGTDFSHPPVSFKYKYQRRCINQKRESLINYENQCIDKINEMYLDKLETSRSFRDPSLIEQVRKRNMKRQMAPYTSRNIQSTRSNRSKSMDNANSSYKNDTADDNNFNTSSYYNSAMNSSRTSSKRKSRYQVPHYELPPQFTEDEQNQQNEQNQQEQQEQGNLENMNNDIVNSLFEVHPPEDKPFGAPKRPNKSKYTDHENQSNDQQKNSEGQLEQVNNVIANSLIGDNEEKNQQNDDENQNDENKDENDQNKDENQNDENKNEDEDDQNKNDEFKDADNDFLSSNAHKDDNDDENKEDNDGNQESNGVLEQLNNNLANSLFGGD